MRDIKQFKLTSGEEIVCDVIEWPDVDGDSPDIVVRNVYKIITAGVPSTEGVRYYQFRPWMVYQDDPKLFQVINGNHVIGEANPSELLIAQYFKVMEDDEKDETLNEDDKLDERMQEYMTKLKEAFENNTDKEHKANVIPFKPKLH
jgi:uncharacterized protein YuzB (UPF0349 family)